MHFPTLTTLTLLTTLTVSTTALQNILIGNKQINCGSGSIKGGQFFLWFSDAPPCENGLTTGYPGYGVDLCHGTYTLQGHTGLTFTGCYGQNGIYPTAVVDDGNPALTCSRVTQEDSALITCAGDCGSQYYGGPTKIFPLFRCT